MQAIVDKVSRLYTVHDRSGGTHLALSWKGRVRFTVPCQAAAQTQTWKLFKPGKLELPMRVQATLPRLLGAVSCVESKNLELIREAIGDDAGPSSCRAGAPGPWYKDTILFVDNAAKPVYIAKAGAGEAVNSLLTNEANWLRALHNDPLLSDHIPEFVAHRSAADFCFVAQRPLGGESDFQLNRLHVELLRKLQKHGGETIPLEESRIYKTLRLRLKRLTGLLSERWSTRLELAMCRIERSLTGAPLLVVAAHNDFTPWNIRLEQGMARVFDWEYADYGQLPLFDPLHFSLIQMLLGNAATSRMAENIRQVVLFCNDRFGKEICYEPEAQALAYLLNLCTLYLSSMDGQSGSHHVLDRCALLLDLLCLQRD